MSAAVLVFVAGLGSEGAEGIDAALEQTMRTLDAATTVAVDELPSEQVALERADGAAVVLVDTDAELSRVQLRVYAPGEGAQWQERTLSFTAHDDAEARTRAVGIVAVAMLPDQARTAPPAPPPAAPEIRRAVVVAPPRPPPPPRLELGAVFAAALGAPSTLGGAAQVRVRVFEQVWLRAAAGARFGRAPLPGSTLDLPLELGAGYRWTLGPHVQLGGRLDTVLQLRQVTPEREVTPVMHSRWLGALRAGPEIFLRFEQNFGLAAYAAPELSFGQTHLQMGSERATLGLLRAYVEVGPYLTF